jgi:hypothetical protein
MHKFSKEFLKHVVIRHNKHKMNIKIQHESKINKMVNGIIKSSNHKNIRDDRCKLTRR